MLVWLSQVRRTNFFEDLAGQISLTVSNFIALYPRMMKVAFFSVIALVAFQQLGLANDKIQSVMKTHFKGETSNFKKASVGELDKATQSKMAAEVKSITRETPPKGSTPEFKEKMEALAAALEAGEKGKIKMAGNCKACHDKHK
jgi:hypothetical protein